LKEEALDRTMWRNRFRGGFEPFVRQNTEWMNEWILVYITFEYLILATYILSDRIPVGARFSAPVQTGPEAHPVSCKMGIGSFPRVRCGRGVTLTPHPLLVPRSKIE
jgi:hypothetical protein